MTKTGTLIIVCVVSTFMAGFTSARIWDNHYLPRIVKPHVAHVAPILANDPEQVVWYECGEGESEIMPSPWPSLNWTIDHRESDAVRQQRWNDAIRCLQVHP